MGALQVEEQVRHPVGHDQEHHCPRQDEGHEEREQRPLGEPVECLRMQRGFRAHGGGAYGNGGADSRLRATRRPRRMEVSDYGVNDTSALEKKVTAVVSATFAIE